MSKHYEKHLVGPESKPANPNAEKKTFHVTLSFTYSVESDQEVAEIKEALDDYWSIHASKAAQHDTSLEAWDLTVQTKED